ncbi:WcaF family extracellular polysaccharide biosynthesis acetyltransferase [Mangrovimonas sp. TPBH4]|uniref:WcaF family extracellular polysaccharide biosynthesis acetyltransferase n=1 Tax=Mangrovimonas sp. TPBH4 TaxID=1645914 RepID=UPI0006B638F8|nr:WcaF family extracellular polysaccharide biosynthesis acetyltransferase [Mangrovimonas sp. TPBH4]
MLKTDLSTYNNDWYQPGNPLKRLSWYVVNALFFVNPLNLSSGLKVLLLKMFGAKIGKGVVIKPGVNIKYPWKLTIGDFSWIGEKVWIDNLGEVTIGSNVCVSQGVMLLCGNHNYKKPSFDLIVGNITVEDGAWVGAKSVVCPGIVLKEHSVLAVNSVATRDLGANGIYQGNPAVLVRNRIIE